jgi:hypothetical protein
MVTFSQLGKKEYGRLGNQMFQIASSIGIACENGLSYCFPDWEYDQYFENRLPYKVLDNFKILNYTKSNFSLITLNKGNWDLRGFFQSEKFFIDQEELIRHYFKPKQQIEKYINDKYGYLLHNKTCSVHVRRGDYTKQWFFFPPQSIEFYRSAINKFDNDTQFLIFSDDIKWCKDNFFGSNIVFIENEKDIIDIFLMSKCKDHIISNSSFSWWGAWLNPNDNKIVICPEKWFGAAVSLNPSTYNDIYATNFIKLQNPAETKFERSRLYRICIYMYYNILQRLLDIKFLILTIIFKLIKKQT